MSEVTLYTNLTGQRLLRGGLGSGLRVPGYKRCLSEVSSEKEKGVAKDILSPAEHPEPWIMNLTPYTLHPALCTLHPTPCTSHPSP